MLQRLPYRVQIPLGLTMAVLLAAMLVTSIAARSQAQTAREQTRSIVDKAVTLVIAQVRPLLAAEDTWRVFALLRDTAQLVPGGSTGHARLAVLTPRGQVFAASDPSQLETGRALLGESWRGRNLEGPGQITERRKIDLDDGSVVFLDPVRSEDGQSVGFLVTEVDAAVFAPDWEALSRPAILGIGLAVLLLAPLGWFVGKQMARPVRRLVSVIERIGKDDPSVLRKRIPATADPELGRIGDAVAQLMGELELRKTAEQRALSAERLAAVGRITAAVAHEINNPLAGLLTATQTLRLHGQTDDVRQRTVDLLGRGLQQIQTTVATLLPQARVEDRPLEPGDLEDIVTLVQSSRDHTACIETELKVESALRVSSSPMRQVMLNLLLNALKAAGDGGVVTAKLKADASELAFSVRNSGPVLDESKFRRILAAERGHDPRGFGLWVCQELANHLHGSFILDGTVRDKTCLVFRVPNREADWTTT
jgi:signal transduction histidine kinase